MSCFEGQFLFLLREERLLERRKLKELKEAEGNEDERLWKKGVSANLVKTGRMTGRQVLMTPREASRQVKRAMSE